jgi:hypothetical protein
VRIRGRPRFFGLTHASSSRRSCIFDNFIRRVSVYLAQLNAALVPLLSFAIVDITCIPSETPTL